MISQTWVDDDVVSDRVYLALISADCAHAGQSYGEDSYLNGHLIPVANLLESWGAGEDLIVAGLLHDIVEDCEAWTRSTVEHWFGARVAEIVWRVTNEPGVNRKDRAAKTYPKIAADSDAVMVKLADRMVNLAKCRSSKNAGMLAMYRKEHPAFRDALYAHTPREISFVWDLLDDALRVGYDEQEGSKQQAKKKGERKGKNRPS